MNRHQRRTKAEQLGRSEAGRRQRPRASNVERAVFWCLLLSILLHGGLVALGAGTEPVAQLGVVVGSDPAPPADSWVGETFDIDTAPTGAGALPQAPQPAAELPSEPAAIPSVEPTPPVTPPPEPSPAGEPPVEPKPALSALPDPKPSTSPTPSQSTKAPALNADSKPSSTSRPTASASDNSAPFAGSPAASSSSERPGNASGSFGASGNRRGVRNLATAFARALPIANSGDPVWTTLPLGPAGSLEVTLEVDEAGKIVGAKPTDASHAPQHLVRLVERTLSLLRAGRFSLSTADTNAGTETFRLEATIDQVEESPAEDRSSAGPYALGFKAPQPGVAGHATFTLQSGRRITIAIKMVVGRASP